MIFNTWTYALFLLVSLSLYWLSPVRARPWLLIGLGLFFYGYYYPPHLLLIVFATLSVFLLSKRLVPQQRHRRPWFFIGVAGCLGLLAYFKYAGFLFESLAYVFPGAQRLHDPATAMRAPLAISFFTFEFIHYLIESYRGTFRPAGLRDFGLFIMFFPTLICGPIKRFQAFNPQEYAQQRFDPSLASAGLERILIGLAKKILIADSVAPYCLTVFANPDAYSWLQLWTAVYGYALQIYFDFSGYSDIAIGSAKLFGYTVPENFNYPYLQSNPAAFWRAWHMSLTSWITDYVYIPLGGSRAGEARAALNRFLAMTLCGLWHGAAFHFVVWGMYHGVGLNLYRFYEGWRARHAAPQARRLTWCFTAFGVVATFHFVCIGWVLFVCDLNKAVPLIGRLLWKG